MDRLTEKCNLPFTRFGIEWRGLPVSTSSSSARKIELLGMKGPYNYFTIFLPKKALEPERKREGMYRYIQCTYLCVCVCTCIVCVRKCPVNIYTFPSRAEALHFGES